MTTLEKFTAGYIAGLVWSSTVENDGETVGADRFDLNTAAADTCRADCLHFYNANLSKINAAIDIYGAEQAGHDFALTRNGTGAGYWDGDLPGDLGDTLTKAAHAAGPCDLYLDDDGTIHAISGTAL